VERSETQRVNVGKATQPNLYKESYRLAAHVIYLYLFKYRLPFEEGICAQSRLATHEPI
jgi:hypothetical protein